MPSSLWLLLLAGLLALMLACAPPVLLPTATPTATLTPTRTPPPTLTPTPVPTPTLTDTGWQPVVPGMEARALTAATEGGPERVRVVRLDPAQFDLKVRYRPGYAAPVSAWAAQTGALLAVNGGFFTEEGSVTGLTISEGEVYGTPYGDYAGMLAVTPEGEVSLRWLRTWPYDPYEPLREAVQSFPVLVKPGGVMGFPADADDGRPARRTVVAQDRGGRLLFLVAPGGKFSLHALATWLVASDLDVEIALNLDGGTSSGMWLQGEGAAIQVESLVPVPSAITVERR